MRILINLIVWVIAFSWHLLVLIVLVSLRIVCELIIYMYRIFTHMYRRLFGKKLHTLFWAAHENQINLVKHFIEEEGVPVDLIEDDEVGTALVVAITVNNYEIAKYLIAKGANVNQVLKDESMPLMQAVNDPDNYKISCLLIENGADVNSTDNVGYTPLDIAWSVGNKDMAV